MELIVTFGLVVAIGGATFSYRSSARSQRWFVGGALLVVAGIVAAYWGFGYAWMASMEERNQAPGAIAFVAGLGGTFAGLGILAGRAFRAARAPAGRRQTASGRSAARIPVMGGLACFLASQVCLVLYLNGYLEGGAGVFAAVCISLTLIAAWLLGALALRAAGRHGAAAFLLVAPWPILAVDVITFTFYESPSVYIITGVAALVVVGLAVRSLLARASHDRTAAA